MKQLEACGSGGWSFPPPGAIEQLRDFADALEKVLEVDAIEALAANKDAEAKSAASGVLQVGQERLKLMIRQQVRAESKSTLTDDLCVAAYRCSGSFRAAAEFLSQQTSQNISKDQVHRAVKRAGGLQAVRDSQDSESIQRVVASQRCDREKKFASPTQPPEIE